MKIQFIKGNVRCDVGGCARRAKYSFVGERSTRRNQLNICEECAREMYKLLGGEFTPKSPQNVLTRRSKATKEES